MPAHPVSKSLRTPDESQEFERVRQDLVDLGDLTVGRVVHQPGWRWSVDMQPRVGGEWCRTRHVGLVLQGRLGVVFDDGATVEREVDDVFDIPPGHDGYVIGDEELVMVEWTGLRTWAGFTGGAHNRVLATLLFTDVVDSTATAARLGDAAWHDLLATHYEAARAAFDRFNGNEVNTTGDGMVARFDGPAVALGCAATIRDGAVRDGVHIRAGVHVGEVQLVGKDVRGVAVHEAARVMSKAEADEILVSETTRALAMASGLVFEERGTHELKGLPGEWRLFAYVG